MLISLLHAWCTQQSPSPHFHEWILKSTQTACSGPCHHTHDRSSHPVHALAVLLAGRLDRMVFCGFPDEADRLAILQACAHKLPLAADVDLAEISKVTVNFTGADLSAILSEGQLLAVHDQLDEAVRQQKQQQDGQDGGSSSSAAAATTAQHGVPVLNMHHLQRALARARPSLPPTEQRRLAAVYARFQHGRDPGISNRQMLDEQQQRMKHATLA